MLLDHMKKLACRHTNYSHAIMRNATGDNNTTPKLKCTDIDRETMRFLDIKHKSLNKAFSYDRHFVESAVTAFVEILPPRNEEDHPPKQTSHPNKKKNTTDTNGPVSDTSITSNNENNKASTD